MADASFTSEDDSPKIILTCGAVNGKKKGNEDEESETIEVQNTLRIYCRNDPERRKRIQRRKSSDFFNENSPTRRR